VFIHYKNSQKNWLEMKHESNKVFNLPSMLWTTYINLIFKKIGLKNQYFLVSDDIQNPPKINFFFS
jgi:hypothetical protein